MKKITTKLEFETASKFVLKMGYNSDIDVSIGMSIGMPDHIKEILSTDSAILPKHLHSSLFKELLIEELRILQPKYKIDTHCDQIIDLIASYSTQDEAIFSENSYKFDKGILIMGKVGCGKTLLMNALSCLLQRFVYFRPRQFSAENLNASYFPAYSITENFIKRGFDIFINSGTDAMVSRNTPSIIGDILLIDDIGSEDIVTSFGNTTNAIGELMLRRYDQKRTLFATTNMDEKNLKLFYGDRVFSRMTEMMNFCVMEGEDRRK